MNEFIRIGMDTSKSLFQLHGVDGAEKVVLRKRFRRKEMMAFFERIAPTVIGIEACGAAHYWARTLTAMGHEVKLLPPQLVKPYVKRNKNDPADAEAICEAMSRPSMRFVPVKSAEAQAHLMLLGMRDAVVRARTQLTNRIRGYGAEFGLIAAGGLDKIDPLLSRIAADKTLPVLARKCFARLGRELQLLKARLGPIEAALKEVRKKNETARRLAQIPSIGPIGALTLALKTPDPSLFRSGRDYAAWLGLTPRDHSSGAKRRLGGITRAGDEAARATLVAGAASVLMQVRAGRRKDAWLSALLARKPFKLAAVALANKVARIAWKLMVSGEDYNPARTAKAAAAQ